LYRAGADDPAAPAPRKSTAVVLAPTATEHLRIVTQAGPPSSAAL
jgi:hypothetical protein